jgi:threonine aldolase
MVYEMAPEAPNPSSQFLGFASDNYSPAHPSVLEWVQNANNDYARPYNDDLYTLRFRSLMNEMFGKQVSVFPSLNGTGTNVFALRSILPRWGTVCAPVTAHSNTDEAGAPEHMAGLKMITAPTSDGKMSPHDVIDISKVLGDIHSAQPKVVTLSNTTERGTFYTADEIGAIVSAAHSRDMLVHIDGARIFNAIASCGYKSLAEGLTKMYGDTGVDAISFGGTKVGAISAEAVVILHEETNELSLSAKYSQKQMGQLASKARYISAQFLALLEDDLALKLAYDGNEKMQLLFKKFIDATNAKQIESTNLASGCSVYASSKDAPASISNGEFSYTEAPSANAFFPTIPNDIVTKLRKDFHFYDIEAFSDATTIRLMTSFATTPEEIDSFITTL